MVAAPLHHDPVGIPLEDTLKLIRNRSLNQIDSLSDQITHLKENLRRGLSLDSLDIAKSYREGDLIIEVNTFLREQIYSYIFAACPAVSSWPVDRPLVDTLDGRNELEEIGVFIDHIQVVETSNKISIPSIVWLQRGNNITDGIGDFLAFIPAKEDFEGRFILAMREIRALGRLVRKNGAATHRLIESGSQVVKSVSSGQLHFAGEWCRGKMHPELPRLDVRVFDSVLSVGFREGFKGQSVISDVAIGPFNF
jgi:hypothetical protein